MSIVSGVLAVKAWILWIKKNKEVFMEQKSSRTDDSVV